MSVLGTDDAVRGLDPRPERWLDALVAVPGADDVLLGSDRYRGPMRVRAMVLGEETS